MRPVSVQTLSEHLDGRRLGDPDARCDHASIDTRTLEPGALFVALRGARADGHDMLDAAAEAGAAAAIVEREVDNALPQIVVPDARAALWRLAEYARHEAQAKVIGLTGSNGKTTVKEMLAAILSRKGPTLWTQGNLNNELGVPLTLCRLNPEHHYAVIEMGANHHGEIRALTALAQPDVGLVNNAAAAHLEGFGSLRGVAEAKGEIYEALHGQARAVVNVDDAFGGFWLGLAAPRRCISFSRQGPGDVWAENIGDDNGFMLRIGDASHWVSLPLPGKHNIMNALAAAAAASALELDIATIAAGLEAVESVPGRLRWLTGRNGVRVLDDSYNANPGSLEAALEVLVHEPGPHWAVLGDMGELGEETDVLHRSAGNRMRSMGVQRLFAVGEHGAAAVTGFGPGAAHFENQQQLIEALRGAVTGNEAILVKGSRSMAMERVVAALRDGADSDVVGER